MIKRIISAVLMIMVMATLVVMPVSAASATIGQDLVDNCASFDNVFSYANAQLLDRTQGFSGVTGIDNKTFQQTAADTTAEVIYKAADGKLFSKITVDIVKHWQATKVLEISTSDDGVGYTQVNSQVGSDNSVINVGWTQVAGGSGDFYVFSYTKELDTPAQYIKLEIPANSAQYTTQLTVNTVDLKVVDAPSENTIAIDTVDNCADFNNVLNYANVQLYNRTQGFSGVTGIDNKTFQQTAVDTTAEVVYKAADGKLFSEITVDILKHYEVKKAVVVSTSDDGKVYTPVNSQVVTDLGWTQVAGGTGDFYLYSYTKKLDKPAKYIKIEIPANLATYITQLTVNTVNLKVMEDMGVDSYVISVGADGKATAKRLNPDVAPTNEKDATLIIAEYNSSNKLEKVILRDIKLKADGTVVEHTLSPSAENTYFKAFLVNNITDFTPYTMSAISE